MAVKTFFVVIFFLPPFSTAAAAAFPADSDSSKRSPSPPVLYDASPHRGHTHLLRYEDNPKNEFLSTLNRTYGLDSLVRGSRDDAAMALRLLHWVHMRWQHDGLNEPTRRDALTILREARNGKNFRCVEYAIVNTACLNAVGLKARTIALYTQDVEVAPVAAAHVATEVFLEDFEKWAFVDPQWDVMPMMNGFPLNAVELHDAISRQDPDLKLASLSRISKEDYTKWILPYLYYLDVGFDNSQTVAGTNLDAKGKTRLMLVPLGAKQPKIFQGISKIDNCVYTNSLIDFYEEPAEFPNK